MKVKPTLMLSMHCPEGRAMVQVGLDDLTEPERAWLFDKLKKAEKGRSISFGVDSEGDAQIIKFTLGATAEAVT
jgi:hypothetical protein